MITILMNPSKLIYRGLKLGPLAVQLLEVLRRAAVVIHEAILRVEVTVFKLESGSNITENAIHFGARGGALAQTPLLTTGPVTNGVCWVFLCEVPFYICCCAAFWTLKKSLQLNFKIVANGSVSYHKDCIIFLQGWNIDDHNAVNDNNSAKNAERIDN